MADRQRSPFGELVRSYRRGLNFSQRGLITQMGKMAKLNPDIHPFSLRTLTDIEGERTAKERKKTNYRANVKSLALTFGLVPDTPAWNHFVVLSTMDPGDASQQGFANSPIADLGIVEPTFIPEGRTTHLARIEAAINATVTQGESGFLLVHARSGSGKTSLVSNAIRLALVQYPDLVTLWGTCTDVATSSLQPFEQALVGMLDPTGQTHAYGLTSEANQQRLLARREHAMWALLSEGRGLVDRLIPADLLTTEIASGTLDPALAASLAMLVANPAPTPDVTSMHVQVAQVLTAYAERGPLILVLDDLHWSDPAAAALLVHLVSYLQGQRIPVLVIGIYRPVDFGLHPVVQTALREMARQYANASIDLSSAIGGQEGYAFTRAYVASNVTNPPTMLVDTIFDITEGHPIAVQALLQVYLRDGALEPNEDGLFIWQQEPATMRTELNDLYGNLVPNLPANLLTLIQVASVQGSTFYAEILRLAVGITNAGLIDLLDERLARRHDLVRPAASIIMSGKRLYGYSLGHALFRDYVYYQLLTPETRNRYHLATARAYVTFFGPGHAPTASVVAFHFEQADHPAEAAEHYQRAGDAALEQYDYPRAREMFEHVQRLDSARIDPFYAAQALVGLGNCARGSGDAPLARQFFEQALFQAEEQQLPRVLASAHTSAGMIEFDAGNLHLAVDHLQHAIAFLRKENDLIEASRSLSLVSHVLHGLGYYDRAAAAATEAISLATDLHHDALLVSGSIALGNCHLEVGDYPEAITIFRRALEIAEEQNSAHRKVLCWVNMALCLIESQQHDDAREMLNDALDLDSLVTPRLTSAVEFNAALLDETQGMLEDAARHYQRSLDLRLQNNQWALAIDSVAGLIRIDIASRKVRHLPQRLATIHKHLEDHGNDGIEHIGRLYVTLSRAHRLLGETDLAEQAISSGLAVISARHAMLKDPQRRHSYLYNIPSHHALIKLAIDAGIDDGFAAPDNPES